MDSVHSLRCEDCSIIFSSRAALENHQRHFCKGSALHQRLIQKQRDEGLLSSQMVSDYLSGAPVPAGVQGIEQMTVDELRQRVVHDAELALVRKSEAAKAVEQAAARLAAQKTIAQAQQVEAEKRMRAQREAALQARVMRRAAEQRLRGAELQSEEEIRKKELDELRRHEQALAEQRAQVEASVMGVQRELAELRGDNGGSSSRRRAELLAQQNERISAKHLTEAASVRRAEIQRKQSEAAKELAQERDALLAKQRRVHQDLKALEADTTNPIVAGGMQGTSNASATAQQRIDRMVKQQAEDERRILLLHAQVQSLKGYDPSSSASYIERITRSSDQTARSVPTGKSEVPTHEPQNDSNVHATPQLFANAGRRASFQDEPTPTRFRDQVQPAEPGEDVRPAGALPSPTAATPVAGATDLSRGRAASIAEELRSLQDAYKTSGGKNAALVDLMAKLQADARALASNSPIVLPKASQNAPRSPLTVPSEVQVHMHSIERALAAREEEARLLQERISALRQSRLSQNDMDSLSDFMQPQSRPGSAGRHGETRQERELREMRAQQEASLALVRHEREMLEEQLRLRKLREDAEREAEAQKAQREHQAWITDQKRQLIEARVAREVARHGGLDLTSSTIPSGQLSGIPYTAESGFVVFWDFVTALPRYVSQCTLVYAVYHGERMLGAVKSLPICDCEPEPGGLGRAIIAVRRQFMHIEANEALHLVAEIQHVTAPAAGPGMPPQTKSVGWTTIPLFTGGCALKAGFWKSPLFRPPINVATPMSERISLEPMKLFLRLVLTSDMERLRSFAVDPDRTAAAYAPAYDIPHRGFIPIQENEGAPAALASETGSDTELALSARSSVGKSKFRAAVHAVAGTNSLLNYVREQAQENTKALFESSSDDEEDLLWKKRVHVHRRVSSPVQSTVEEYSPQLGLEVRAQRLREWRPPYPVSFIERLRETGINPLHVHLSLVAGEKRWPGGMCTGAGQLDATGSWTIDWVDGITFHPVEEMHSDVWMLVEVFDMVIARNLGYKPPAHPRGELTAEASMGPPPPAIISWGRTWLFERTPSEQMIGPMLIVGSRTIRLGPPPVTLQGEAADISPPPDDIPSGELQLLISRGTLETTKEATMPFLDRPPKEIQKRDNFGVPQAAWIDSGPLAIDTGSRAHTFETPVDVYVDGARYLPDDLVVCRVRVMLLDGMGQPISETVGWPSLLSDSRSPKFSAKLTLSGQLPVNSTVVVSIVGMQKGEQRPRQVGFAALALFYKQYQDPPSQPENSEGEVVLNKGDFQLPLLIGFPEEVFSATGGSINEAATMSAPRIPCATVLVRILLSSQTVPAPAYASGRYMSYRSIPEPHEVVLYRARLLRDPLVAFEAIKREVATTGEVIANQNEAERWMKLNLSGTVEARFDLMSFAKYNPVAGLQISVHKAHNLPYAFLSFGIVSLFPPGALYRSPSQTTGVKFTTQFDWSSSLRSPIWTGGPSHVPQVPFDTKTLVVVEVRMMRVVQQPTTLEIVGWSVVPAFFGDTANSGIFRLPLYAGSPPPGLLKEMREGDWQSVLAKAIAARAIKFVESSSVEVSILDGQRFGEHDSPEFRPEIDISLLPGKKLKLYMKDVPSKPLSSLLKDGDTIALVQDLAIRAFYEAIGLKP